MKKQIRFVNRTAMARTGISCDLFLQYYSNGRECKLNVTKNLFIIFILKILEK